MIGRTHQVIGLTSGLATYVLTAPAEYAPATFAAVLVISSLAALLPDIDQPGASIWNHLPFGGVVGEMVNPFLQHRNLTHSILGYVLIVWGFATLLFHAPAYWGLDHTAILVAFCVAYASHILADMVTVQGVPLLFPYQNMFGIPPFPFQGFRIETGQWFENLVVFPVVNLILVILIVTHWGTIHSYLFH